ncbi:MAG: pyrroline-5-carboxylate reductase [Caulobacteraceae bacterium]
MSSPEHFRGVAFYGCGSMGSALVRGFARDDSPTRLVVIARDRARMQARLEGTPAVIVTDPGAPEVGDCDAVLIGVKPQVLREIVSDLAPLCAGRAVISVAAGVDCAFLRKGLPEATSIIRSLPNLAVAKGEGLTALCATADVGSAQNTSAQNASDRRKADALFAPAGGSAWVGTEDELNVVTAISGSALAFYFAFTEALAAVGEGSGLDGELAGRFALQTLVGAGAMAKGLGLEQITALKHAVTSKGGTTAAGLAILEGEQGFKPLLQSAVDAAIARARQL